jgi:hypothetical protein
MGNETTFSMFLYKILNLSPSGNYEMFIRIFRFVLPYLLFFFITLIFFHHKDQILRFISILGIFMFIFIPINEVNKKFFTEKKKKFTQNSSLVEPIADNTKKKLVWFILDAYAPDIADKYIDLLPNYANLKNSSFVHDNMIMPAKQSIISIPSQFMGVSPRGTKVKNKKYYIIDNEKKLIEYNYKNTIFSKLREKGIETSLYSSFIRYCSVFLKKNEFYTCKDAPLDKRSFYNILNRSQSENLKGVFFIFSPNK